MSYDKYYYYLFKINALDFIKKPSLTDRAFLMIYHISHGLSAYCSVSGIKQMKKVLIFLKSFPVQTWNQ